MYNVCESEILISCSVHMVRKLLESGLGPKEIAWSQILPTSGKPFVRVNKT